VELQHTFTVPAPIDRAWSTLLDVEGVAPCFPGASLTGVEGEEFSGTVKVKLGPVSLQYVGKGRFVERDESARRVVLEANGTDKRGNGTAGATVQARLEPDGEGVTRVVVDTDLKVTGRPAQFGRGLLQDVGGKIIEQFASCLASRMSAPEEASAASGSPAANGPALAGLADGESQAATSEWSEEQASANTSSPDGAGGTSVSPTATASASGVPTTSGRHAAPANELDLGSVLLPSLARRYGPGLLAGLVAVLIVWVWRRRAR
jgi:carbon monoxide dehydrogenase subunit G